MQTSIIITSTDPSGKKKQHTVTNIDPTATNAELSEFAQMVNALSTSDYVETNRVDKQNVLESSPSNKIEAVITVDNSGVVSYNGDGTLYYQYGESEAYTLRSGDLIETEQNGYLFATATDNYTAAVLIYGQEG